MACSGNPELKYAWIRSLQEPERERALHSHHWNRFPASDAEQNLLWEKGRLCIFWRKKKITAYSATSILYQQLTAVKKHIHESQHTHIYLKNVHSMNTIHNLKCSPSVWTYQQNIACLILYSLKITWWEMLFTFFILFKMGIFEHCQSVYTQFWKTVELALKWYLWMHNSRWP